MRQNSANYCVIDGLSIDRPIGDCMLHFTDTQLFVDTDSDTGSVAQSQRSGQLPSGVREGYRGEQSSMPYKMTSLKRL
jgi:hypothetical protein